MTLFDPGGICRLSKAMDSLFNDLDIPTSLKQLLERDSVLKSEFVSICKVLGLSKDSYEHQQAAGRLLLALHNKTSYELKDYVSYYESRLAPTVVRFIRQHESVLGPLTEDAFERTCRQQDFMSAQSNLKQYLLHYTQEPSYETVQQCHLRQSVGLYNDEGLPFVISNFNGISHQRFTLASPGIFNGGTVRGQQGSCFLLEVDDTMESITGTVSTISRIFKANGGVGIGLNSLRKSSINNSGESAGPTSFMGIYDQTVVNVSQGNRRNGAGTAFLRSNHLDFEHFVRMTNNRTQDRMIELNTCTWMDDAFYLAYFAALENPESKAASWYLFCPNQAPEIQGVYGRQFRRRYAELIQRAEQRELEYQRALSGLEVAEHALLNEPTSAQSSFQTRTPSTLRAVYYAAQQEVSRARKRRIAYRRINPCDLMEQITEMQMESGMPYMVNGDAVNQKSNLKNLGSINSSNLCLEVMQPTSSRAPASCNLGSINARAYVRGQWDWQRDEQLVRAADVVRCYDFGQAAHAIRSLVETLCKVIYTNFNPGDEELPTGEIRRGELALLNYRTMPLGIGISGTSDALAEIDVPYQGPFHSLWNRLYYANQAFNGWIYSMLLAIRDGECEAFRAGSHLQYVGTQHPEADEDGYIRCTGTPMSQGRFQHDLWSEDAQILEDEGHLNVHVYDRSLDQPIEPTEWGQTTLYAYVQPGAVPASAVQCGAVPESRRTVPEPLPSLNDVGTVVQHSYGLTLTSTRRTPRVGEIEVVIPPSWSALSELLKLHGARNTLLFAPMPTASSANLLRNAESTEAHASNIYARNLKTGQYTVINRHLYFDLKQLGLWNTTTSQLIQADLGRVRYLLDFIEAHPKIYSDPQLRTTEGRLQPKIRSRLEYLMRKYRTMFEISIGYSLRLSRERGIYVCQSESHNIYCEKPNHDTLEEAHIYAWSLRLKTGMYYLRSRPANRNESFTVPAWITMWYRNHCLQDLESDPIVKTNDREPTPESVPLVCDRSNRNCLECSA